VLNRSSSSDPEITRSRAPGTPTTRAEVELFLISFLILFFELACIRWFGSTVIFLTYFTNIVLLACFLGASVGCLIARQARSWINGFVPLVLLGTASAAGFLWTYSYFTQVIVDVGSQQQSPQLIYFGTDARIKDPSKLVVPIEAIAGYFFVVIAVSFIGLGQEMGRRFDAIAQPMRAYTADILGSLTGIAVFGLTSYLCVPAAIWFLIVLCLGLGLVKTRRWLHALFGLGVLAAVAAADWPRDSLGVETEVIWSPYYQVRFKPRYLSIDVNNLGHQGMVSIDRAGPAYLLPHLLNRAAGGKPFGDILVIGAGSGNDVAAALSQGVRRVDAVEIDPVINQLGQTHHPNRPFRDPRVSVHLDDGRSFVRTTRARYDLISYALVDSLALHSSYSSVRLENFLFTEEAFRDVKAKLKPGGVFAMYNYYRQGWVIGRLVRLAERVFGSSPIVISLPFQRVISPGDNQRDCITFLLVGNGQASIVESIRAQFAMNRLLWINSRASTDPRASAFGLGPPSVPGVSTSDFMRIGPAIVKQPERDWIPQDDWPFLYLRAPTIPALNVRGMALVAVLSSAIVLAVTPVRRVRPNGRMFFLGAGFMLLETKGVVHMALLFGATWVVNSIVFFAILTMILLANVYVLIFKPRRLVSHYAFLLLALLIASLVPMDTFLSLPGVGKVVGSCAVVFLPVFFAGVIFATTFRSSVRTEIDFGSNIGGIVLGGLSEYLSLVLGFNHLLWVAMGYYGLSALLGRQSSCGTPAVDQER
jgi:SAM-dependent methyltransferase